MVNLRLYSTAESTSSKTHSAITDTRDVPTPISQDEAKRRLSYIIQAAYYHPSREGLYQTEVQAGQYLSDVLEWTKESNVSDPHYPRGMRCFYNPVPLFISLDVSSLLNDFKLAGITVIRNGDEAADLTTWLRDCLAENKFKQFFRRLFSLSASMGMAYVRAVPTPTMRTKLRLYTYPADSVYPVLDADDHMRATAFRIWFRTRSVDLPNDPSMYQEGPLEEYYHFIDAEGQRIYRDNVLDTAISEEWGNRFSGTIPMVAFPWQQFDGYFGMSACERILPAIDSINLEYTSMHDLTEYMMWPKIILKNCSMPTTSSGAAEIFMRRTLQALSLQGGANVSMEVMQAPIASGFQELVKDIKETVESMMPHTHLLRAMSSMVAQASDTLTSRASLYITHAYSLQDQQAENISSLCNMMLRVAGKTAEDIQINVEMGPPISQSTKDKLGEIKQELDTFGNADQTYDWGTEQMGYTDEERMAMLEGKTKSAQPPVDLLQARIQQRIETMRQNKIEQKTEEKK